MSVVLALIYSSLIVFCQYFLGGWLYELTAGTSLHYVALPLFIGVVSGVLLYFYYWSLDNFLPSHGLIRPSAHIFTLLPIAILTLYAYSFPKPDGLDKEFLILAFLSILVGLIVFWLHIFFFEKLFGNSHDESVISEIDNHR